MSFPARAGAIAATLILLSACGPRDDKYNPTHFAVVGPVVPAEVVLPAGLKRGETFGGLHPSWDANGICCTADPQLDLPVSKSTTGPALHAYVYLAASQAATRLAITFSDGTKELTAPLKAGFAHAVVLVPLSLRAVKGVIRVRIASPSGPFTLVSVYFD